MIASKNSSKVTSSDPVDWFYLERYWLNLETLAQKSKLEMYYDLGATFIELIS